MHIPTFIPSLTLPLAAILVVACAGGGSAGWTYAPLGPSPSAAASGAASPAASGGAASPAASGGAASPAASGAASPAASGAASPAASGGESPAASGAGTTIDVATPPDQPLAFVPNQLTMPAGASVTVNYLNDSNLPHNINFFNGPDASAPSLGATATVTGPGAPESVTITAPSEPGQYYFWCDVHATAMQGTYTVQ
jgi:plastocyanin